MKTKITILLLFICSVGIGQDTIKHVIKIGKQDTVYYDPAHSNFVRKAGVVYLPLLNDTILLSYGTNINSLFKNSVTVNYIRNPFSEFSFNYTGTRIKVKGISTIASPFNHLTILVNGDYFGILNYNTFNVQEWKDVLLPAGNKGITIVEGATSMPGTSNLGTWLTGLLVDSSKYIKYPYTHDDEKILFVVNSIGVGDRTTNPATMSFTKLFNTENNKEVIVYGWGYNKLMRLDSTQVLQDTTVNRFDRLLGSALYKKIVIMLGTNDYGLKSTPADTFGKYYGKLLDAIHIKIPTAHIYPLSPIYRYGETSLLADYRSKIDSVSLAKNDYCTYLNPYSALTYPTDYNDIIHPNTAGHKKLKDYIYPITQLQPETDTIIKRFAINLNRNQILGIDSMVVMLKDSGIYNRADLIYVMNVNDSIGALQDWKTNAYNLTSSAGIDFTTKLGFAATTTTAYLNTNWIASTNGVNYKKDTATIAIWSLTNITEGGYDCGVFTNTTYEIGISARSAALKAYGFVNGGNWVEGYPISTSIGLFAANRLGTNLTMYHNTDSITWEANSSNGLPTKNLYICNVNNNGTLLGNSTTRRYSFFYAGRYLGTVYNRRLYNILTWWNAKAAAIF
jgi:hypothetical protein